MGTSEKSFNQVKAILGKLDRSISEARDKRTKPTTPATGNSGSTVLGQPSHASSNHASNAAQGAPASNPAPGTSGYGRATPLPPRNGPQTPPPLRWGA